MKQAPILTIPDEARAALTGKLPERAKRLPNPRTQALIAWAVSQTLRRQMFGEQMKPTLKQRLLMWSSFTALKTGMRQ